MKKTNLMFGLFHVVVPESQENKGSLAEDRTGPPQSFQKVAPSSERRSLRLRRGSSSSHDQRVEGSSPAHPTPPPPDSVLVSLAGTACSLSCAKCVNVCGTKGLGLGLALTKLINFKKEFFFF